MNCIFYFKTADNNFRVLYNDTLITETLIFLPDFKAFHRYELFKGYDASDDGLLNFKKDFEIWSKQI